MEEQKAHKAHVVVLPFYGQGHLNPMLQFSKRLASKGLKITVATILSATQTMPDATGSIIFESIYDDCKEGGFSGPGGFKGYLERFEASGRKNLSNLIKKIDDSDSPVKCLVYDANIPWALRVAKELGLAAASFFTQACSAIASYYPMHLDLLGKQLPASGFSMPALPEIKIPTLRSMGSDSSRYPPIIMQILEQFDNIEEADWVLFNSFDKLEGEVSRIA